MTAEQLAEAIKMAMWFTTGHDDHLRSPAWNIAHALLHEHERAEAAEAKLAEREAELAKADAVIASLAPMPLGPRDRPTLNETLRDSLSEACTRHAARQRQNASAEPTEREGK